MKPAPQTAKDVTPALLALAENVYDDWFDDDEPIDWERFIDKMSTWMSQGTADGWEEFDTYWNPAISKIQRHIRAYRRGVWHCGYCGGVTYSDEDYRKKTEAKEKKEG